MTGRTHDMAAVTALLGAVIIAPPGQLTLATALLAILANLIGGIAPDIDEPTAPFWRNLPIGGVFGRLITRMMGGHRFITHSLVGVAILAWLSHLLLMFLSPILTNINITLVWYAFLLGLGSHLVMDTLTKEGVPWLLPVPIKFGVPPLREWRITTGKAVETFVVFPLLIGINIWLVSTNYHALLVLIHRHIT